MGRIVSNFFISLDGVVQSPEEWHLPYFDDAMGAIVSGGMADSKGLVMGRTLYGEWSQFWPSFKDDPQLATYFHDVPKYVISHHDGDADWNNTTVVTGGDDEAVADQVRELKDSVDGDLQMSGSATTVRWLLANGLLDELALLVHPIAVGKGQRLFEDTPTHALKLTHSETLPTGVLHLKYEPAEAAG